MLKKTPILFIAFLIVISARSQSKEGLQRRVLSASHSTRIDDVEMKPWHLKVNFELYGHDGKVSNAGVLEEWFAGLTLWKLRIESPSYTATVIEDGKDDFRTKGSGPVPLRLRAIERDIVYPMPMGEDLSKTVPHSSHLKLEQMSLDCIQLTEPPIPSSSSPTFCFDPTDGDLRAILSDGSWSLIRNKVGLFEGHSAALRITARVGNVETETASAEVVDLSEITLNDALFVPSSDMEKVTDMHKLKVETR
jgi:hypothetical protein